GVVDRKLRRLAHQVERGRASVLAVGGEPDAGDEAHGAVSPASFRGATKSRALMRNCASENPLGHDPCGPMDSGLVASLRPGMTDERVPSITPPSLRLGRRQGHAVADQAGDLLRRIAGLAKNLLAMLV